MLLCPFSSVLATKGILIYQTNNLRIRNDQSLNRTFYQLNENTDATDNYSSILNMEKELVSEDQGVYCLATGTSFSLTSNISSVTSQFVDGDNNNVTKLDISNLNDSENSRFEMKSVNSYLSPNPIERTRLSLFDLTPTPLRLTKSKKFEINNQVLCDKEFYLLNQNLNFQQADSHRLSDEMKNWIFTNFVSNCVENKKEKISLTDENESIGSTSIMRMDEENECII